MACCLLLLSFLFLVCPAYATKNSPIRYIERSFEEELILSVRFKNYILSDGIIAFQHQTGVLLPLGEIMAALDFAVEVNTHAGTASGWFLRENRGFYLDVLAGELTLLGQKKPYQKELVELHEDDIYVDASLFAQWFPVDIEVALPLSRVTVTSREPLPLEERLEREMRQGRLGGGSREEVNLPPLDIPYSLISIPGVDVNLRSQYRNTGGEKTWSSTYNTYMAGDLLYMTGNLFLSGDRNDKLKNARLTLERKYQDSKRITPLHISEIKVGDVFTPSIPLMLRSQSGRGVSLSNFPIESVREFDRITLRGDLPIGWEVELYRNDSLISAQSQPDDDGRYEFTNVSLLFGLNVIKLQFYGPQGQRREEIKRYNVGADSTPPGKNLFSFAINQQDQDLFDSINNAGNSSVDNLDKKAVRSVLEYERGINTRISATAAIASIPMDGKRKSIASVGARFSAFGTFSKVKLLRLFGGGNAYEVSTQFEFNGININASHQNFFLGYESEEITAGSDPVRNINKITINGVFAPPLSIIPRLSYGFNFEHEKRDSGEAFLNYTNRLSGSIKNVSFTNNITGKSTLESEANTEDTLSGNFLINTSDLFDIKDLSVRGGFGYEVKPVKEFTTVSITSDYSLNKDFGLRFGVDKQLTGEQITSYSAGVNKEFDMLSLSTDASYNDKGDFSISMNMNFSLDFNNGRYIPNILREKSAGNGSIISQIYLDNNGNKVFDNGDEPIEEAKLKIGNRASKEVSGEDGIVRISGLSSYRSLNISLDKTSLPDPFWVSVMQGNKIVPRPGKTIKINFPVSMTGEIDGTVYMDSIDDIKEISNVIVELLNQKGEVLKTEKTAFDGFYLFLNVLPGEYSVRISPKQLEKFGVESLGEQSAEIENDGTIINGADFYLKNISSGDNQ